MRSCIDCKFMTDYGYFLLCDLTGEIIRHEKRTALFCKFHRPITACGEALDDFYDALNEFLDNYPGGDTDEED